MRDKGKLNAGIDKIGPWGSRSTSEVMGSMEGGIHPFIFQLVFIMLMSKPTSMEIAL